MTTETRSFLQSVLKNEFDPIQDEIYAIVPEGKKNIAVARAWLESKGKTILFLVWKRNSGRMKYMQIKKVANREELHVDQIVVQNGMVIISIDAGEGYGKRHLMEKREIPLSELKGLKK
ncbi:MAG: hypothetical protein AB1333_02840 [Patescibacteria group bacterium]